eukprot:GHVH01005807.1.p1 GENE.GHVH01005807.1~~GHVH01005807.1.p1  ORF type:complete len:171 (+),score=20.95 GHVH01005807.1:237-749(+)
MQGFRNRSTHATNGLSISRGGGTASGSGNVGPSSVQISEEDIQEINDVFQIFDITKRHALSYYEFRASLRALGFDYTKQEIFSLMQQHGTKLGGKGTMVVTQDTFVGLMKQKYLDRDPTEVLRHAFNLFDVRKVGRISLSDLKHVVGSVVSTRPCQNQTDNGNIYIFGDI